MEVNLLHQALQYLRDNFVASFILSGLIPALIVHWLFNKRGPLIAYFYSAKRFFDFDASKFPDIHVMWRDQRIAANLVSIEAMLVLNGRKDICMVKDTDSVEIRFPSGYRIIECTLSESKGIQCERSFEEQILKLHWNCLKPGEGVNLKLIVEEPVSNRSQEGNIKPSWYKSIRVSHRLPDLSKKSFKKRMIGHWSQIPISTQIITLVFLYFIYFSAVTVLEPFIAQMEHEPPLRFVYEDTSSVDTLTVIAFFPPYKEEVDSVLAISAQNEIWTIPWNKKLHMIDQTDISTRTLISNILRAFAFVALGSPLIGIQLMMFWTLPRSIVLSTKLRRVRKKLNNID
jgi:hypothetical protein